MANNGLQAPINGPQLVQNNSLTANNNLQRVPQHSPQHSDIEDMEDPSGIQQRADSSPQETITHAITPPSHEGIHDIHSLSRSMFRNEGKAALAWIVFTSFYWTLVVWIPIFFNWEFLQPGFIGWCFGSIAMMSSFYAWKEGFWPSGATRDNPNETGGKGRLTAFGLMTCVTFDFLTLSFFALRDGIDDGKDIASVTRGSCHVLSLLWASLFFFNRFHHTNPDIAVTAFFGEWLDIALTVSVMFVLHNALDTELEASDVQCLEETVCLVYYLSFIFQLIGWLFPMMLLEGWGTGKDGMRVSRHLFILDLLTDIPIIFAILLQDAYKDHVIILIDVLWKVILTIRSIGYYMIYEIWLQKGQRVFRRDILDRQRGDTLN